MKSFMDADLRSRALEALDAFPQGDTPSPIDEIIQQLKSGHPELVEQLRAAFFEDGLRHLIAQTFSARAKGLAIALADKQFAFEFLPGAILVQKEWKPVERLSLREFRGYIDWRAKTVKGRGSKLKAERAAIAEMRKLYRDAKRRAGSDVSITLSAALALRATRGRH